MKTPSANGTSSDTLQAALHKYQNILKAEPDNLTALEELGLIYGQLGRTQEALECFTAAVAVRPDNATLHFNHGKALQTLERFDDALASYARALALAPGFVQAYNNRGNVLKALDRLDEALASYAQALALNPAYHLARLNRAAALTLRGDYAAALAEYDTLIGLSPATAELHLKRGEVLRNQQRYGDALAAFERAITLQADYAEAYYAKSHLHLLLGDFEQGWALYEWRWQTAQHKSGALNIKQPLWLGDAAVAGKTILLHAEQGLGDTIQFVRYLPMVEALGAKVILGAPAALAPLLATLKGNFTLITHDAGLPAFDLHCPLMSLPLAFKTRLDSIPAETPYLGVAAQKRDQWQQRLGQKTRPRIGLTWSGNPKHTNDRKRSMPLASLQPLLELDYEFHLLQKEIRAADKARLAQLSRLHVHGDALNDFGDTAALIAEMDLVISVDTSVAHLAGALAKPVWLMLPHAPDFRWLTDRSDSPWYPSARLFRQKRPGDWDRLIAELMAELPSALARP